MTAQSAAASRPPLQSLGTSPYITAFLRNTQVHTIPLEHPSAHCRAELPHVCPRHQNHHLHHNHGGFKAPFATVAATTPASRPSFLSPHLVPLVVEIWVPVNEYYLTEFIRFPSSMVPWCHGSDGCVCVATETLSACSDPPFPLYPPCLVGS